MLQISLNFEFAWIRDFWLLHLSFSNFFNSSLQFHFLDLVLQFSFSFFFSNFFADKFIFNITFYRFWTSFFGGTRYHVMKWTIQLYSHCWHNNVTSCYGTESALCRSATVKSRKSSLPLRISSQLFYGQVGGSHRPLNRSADYKIWP